jgi:hypothetical protein
MWEIPLGDLERLASTPTMEKAKAWLKEHGQVLEEEV